MPVRRNHQRNSGIICDLSRVTDQKTKRRNSEYQKHTKKRKSRRVCRLWNKKSKAKGTTNGESQLYRGSCSSCLCSCVPHPCDLIPSWPCFVHPKHFHRRQRKRESARVVDKRERAGTECVCKSFKRPVKIASEVGSAVKHKANYRLNIFRYISSCRGRRGLWSLFFDLCTSPTSFFPFSSSLSHAATIPDDEPDEERAKHDKGSFGISFNDDRRNR